MTSLRKMYTKEMILANKNIENLNKTQQKKVHSPICSFYTHLNNIMLVLLISLYKELPHPL